MLLFTLSMGHAGKVKEQKVEEKIEVRTQGQLLEEQLAKADEKRKALIEAINRTQIQLNNLNDTYKVTLGEIQGLRILQEATENEGRGPVEVKK